MNTLMIYTKLILIFTTISNLLLIVIINYFKGPKSIFRVVLNFYIIGILGWATGIFSNLYLENIFIEKLIFAFPAIVLLNHFIFSEIFPEGKFPKRTLKYLLLIPPILFFLVSFIKNSLFTKIQIAEQGYTIIDQGPLSLAYSVFILFYIIFPIITLYTKFKNETSKLIKTQLKYLSIGYAFFLVSAVLSNLILPYLFKIYFFNALGPTFSILMVAFIIYNIKFHNLFGIKKFIRKGAIFALLFSIIAFIFIFLSSLLERYVSISISHVIPSLIIVIGFIPLKNFIEFATDKIFFRKHYKFTDVISDTETVIRQSGLNLDSLLDGLHNVIKNALRVNRAIILILTPTGHFISNRIIDGAVTQLDLGYDSQIISHLESCAKTIINKEDLELQNHQELGMTQEIKDKIIKELDQLNFTVVAPIKLNNKIIGIYLVGEKLSQDSFNKEDIGLLEHITSEMAFAIENARIYEELKRLDKSKSEFISVASHQLRTPLSIIKWNLELFADKATTQEQKNDILKDISDSIISMGEQSDKLLIAFEIEDRKNIFLDKKLSCLKMLTEECLAKYEKILKEKNISYETIFPETLPSITYDLVKIKKSIDALMQNAITYTPKGGKIIIKYQIKKINGKDYAIYSISDNGIGINENDQKNIFKKFFRSEEARTMSPNGFGLDLFIVKKYIEAHGGNLWFEPYENKKGASFLFSIPL